MRTRMGTREGGLVRPLLCLAVLLASWGSSAHAATTITVISGSYVIPPGETRQNLVIRLMDVHGSVVLSEGSRLLSSTVDCVPSAHAAPGVMVQGGNSLLQQVEVMGHCGHGVVVGAVSGFRYWQGKSTPKGVGVWLAGTTASEIFGVWVTNNQSHGVLLQGASDNQVVATLVYQSANPDSVGIWLDAGSHGNQLIRVRSNFQGILRVDADDNLTWHSTCHTPVGYTDCVGAGHEGQRNYGDPADYTPRWRTVCTPASYQGSACDFTSLQTALAAADPGDRLVADTNKTAGWGDIVVNKPGMLVLGNTLTMKGSYNYIDYLNSLTVTAPGVHVQNFFVRGAVTVLDDTVLVAIR